MKITQLVEALKPSQYRDLVKGWDKKRYEDIFKQYPTDKKHFRIYLPIEGKAKKVEAPSEIKAAVEAAGYEIEDYISGVASKDEGKRKIKIGKILARGAPELAQKFANDPKRQASKDAEYYVVISRHPYDIAGMSTDRGWTSCMNVGGGSKASHFGTDQRGHGRGSNAHYVPVDIKEGSLVAYLVKNDDKNINNPQARMLIKPFVDIADEQHVAFGVQNKIYGTPVDGFKDVVAKWVDGVNTKKQLNGMFQLNDKVYNDDRWGDTSNSKVFGEVGEQEKRIFDDPYSIEHVENPSERLQMIAIRKRADTISYIKDPTEKVIDYFLNKYPHGLRYVADKPKLTEEHKITAVKNSPSEIRHLKNPSEEIQIAAVSADNCWHYLLSVVPEPSEAVKKAAVSHYPRVIEEIKNPSQELKDLALTKDGSLIEKIADPTEEQLLMASTSYKDLLKWMKKKKMKWSTKVVTSALEHFPTQIRIIDTAPAELVKHAISHDGHAIEYILHRQNLNPDIKNALMLDAVKQNGLAIKWIENPSKQVQMAAVKNDPQAIKYIKNPHPSVKKYVNDNKPRGWDAV